MRDARGARARRGGPGGILYAFEKGVEKTGGGKGFADVWYENRFAFEYKAATRISEGRLPSAPAVPGGAGHPPLLVVTDTDRYEVHTDFTGPGKRVYRFDNAALPKAENVGVLQALFKDPEALRPGYTVEGIAEEASFGTPAPKSSSIKGQTAVGRRPSRRRTWRSTRCGPCESSAPNAPGGSRQEWGQHLAEGAKRELRRARRPPL